MTRKEKKRKTLPRLWNLAALAFILLPIGSLLIGSLQSEQALLSNVQSPLPKEITFRNFIVLILGDNSSANYPVQVEHFPRAFLNSTIVSGLTSFLTVFLGALSAYSLARLPFRGRNAYSFIVLATRMVPLIALVIPLFITLRSLGLLNTLTGLILTQTGFLLPFTIWLLRAYFESLPADMEEAARVDGCSRLGTFFRVVLPLSAPGMSATFVITFLLTWNELLIPITLGSSKEVQTLPVLLGSFISDFSLQYSIVNATAFLALTPTVILALLLQKYVVAGLTAGAVKG
ncbi:MAG: sugar transporter permease [Deltaproteobacteria bacterium]|nr:sugar transporter permease [Deltaproteobacteria bacterium]